MNQKTPTKDTITRKDITLILDSIHELKQDVRELKQDVRELKQDVRELKQDVKKSKDDFKKYKNENMNRLDDIMGEFQNFREDNTIGTYQIRELRENVDDHEKRITKLEKKPAN